MYLCDSKHQSPVWMICFKPAYAVDERKKEIQNWKKYSLHVYCYEELVGPLTSQRHIDPSDIPRLFNEYTITVILYITRCIYQQIIWHVFTMIWHVEKLYSWICVCFYYYFFKYFKYFLYWMTPPQSTWIIESVNYGI